MLVLSMCVCASMQDNVHTEVGKARQDSAFLSSLEGRAGKKETALLLCPEEFALCFWVLAGASSSP